ncbi:MAG: XTP/dITP diphosphatase [Promethearchaeota archaeon]
MERNVIPFMNPTTQILNFCTGNLNKVKEVQSVFASALPEIKIAQNPIKLTEIQAETLEEVALFKSQSIQDKIKPPFFIEDAGFFVDDHLHGFPGVYSHYVMETIGCQGILALMDGKSDRRAHFEAVIAYMDEGKNIYLFKGENKGSVALEQRGTSGFGFDPIFISSDTPRKTFAEIGLEEKNKISHRRRALEKFIEFLKSHPL